MVGGGGWGMGVLWSECCLRGAVGGWGRGWLLLALVVSGAGVRPGLHLLFLLSVLLLVLLLLVVVLVAVSCSGDAGAALLRSSAWLSEGVPSMPLCKLLDSLGDGCERSAVGVCSERVDLASVFPSG